MKHLLSLLLALNGAFAQTTSLPTEVQPAVSGAPVTNAGEEKIPVRERERTVYVPFEELEKVFQDGGRGVFLPYREFLELWNELTLKREQEEKPPADGVVSRAEYSGRVEGNSLVLDAKISVESFQKGWVSLPIGGTDMAGIGEAQTGKAVLQSSGDGYKILLPEKGVYDLTLRLFIPVEQEGGRFKARLVLPRAGVSRLTALIAGEAMEFVVKPAAAYTTRATGAGETELSFFFGAGTASEISWGAPQGATTLTPLLLADTKITTSIGAGSIATTADIAYRIMRAPVGEFRITIPSGQEVLGVTGADIREWNVTPGAAGRQMLVVRANEPVKDAYALKLSLESPVAKLPAEVALPDLVIEGASYARGTAMVQTEPQFDVAAKTLDAVVRSNVSKAAADAGLMLAGNFRLLKQPWKLTLDVTEARPQVEVGSETRLEILREAARVETILNYQIRRVGLFEARVGLPAGLSLNTVKGEGIGEWSVEGTAPTQVLVVKLPQQRTGALSLTITGRQVRAKADDDLAVPVFTPQNVTRHEAKTGVAVHSSLEVNTKSAGDFQQEDVSALGAAKSDDAALQTVLAFRHRDAARPALLGFKSRDPQVSVEILTLVEAKEQGTRHQWTLAFDVAYAAVDRFVLSVPKAVAGEIRLLDPLVKQTNKSFTPDAQKYPGLDTASNAFWEVELRSEKTGAFEIALSHEKQGALEAGKTGRVEMLQVHVPGAFQETGQVAVTKDDSLEIRDSKYENLEEMDARELRPALQKPGVFLAMKYRTPPVKLAIEVAKNDYFEVPRAVITHADLITGVATDRAQSTEVIYWVRNIDMQFLVVRLPQGAQLVSDVFVRRDSQQPMKREGSEDLLVRLPSGSETNRDAFPVRFVYQVPSAEPGVKLGWRGSLEIAPPEVADVKVFETRHRLYLPEQWHYTRFDGPLTRSVLDRGWMRVRRVIDPLIPAFGPQAKAGNDWKWNDPPAVAADVKSLYDFQAPSQGHQETLRRLGPPDRITAHFRSEKITTAAEAVTFLLVTLLGVYCCRCGLRSKMVFVVIFGIGAVLMTGLLDAVDGRIARAVIIAVGLVVALWIVLGVSGLLRRIVSRGEKKTSPTAIPASASANAAPLPATIPKSTVPPPVSEPPPVRTPPAAEAPAKEAKPSASDSLEFPDVGDAAKEAEKPGRS
jgi:hypothetical protein